MPLDWDDRKRLLRMHGIADELLTSARAGAAATPKDAMARELDAVAQEVHLLLLDADGPTAAEFERVVLQGGDDPSSPEIRSAVLVGWLKAGLQAEAMEAQQEIEDRPKLPERSGRKQSIGLKVRSPVVREPKASSDG